MCLSRYEAVDLVAVAGRKIDELNAEAELELAITHDSSGADLVTSGKTKAKNYSRTIQRRNKTLNEDSVSGQVEYSTVPAAPIHFATGAQKVLKLGSIASRSTSTHGTHNNSPFAMLH